MDAKTLPNPHSLHSNVCCCPSSVPYSVTFLWSRTHPGSRGALRGHVAHEVAGRCQSGAVLVPISKGQALPTSGFLLWRPAQSLCCAGELVWESVEAIPRCPPKVLHSDFPACVADLASRAPLGPVGLRSGGHRVEAGSPRSPRRHPVKGPPGDSRAETSSVLPLDPHPGRRWFLPEPASPTDSSGTSGAARTGLQSRIPAPRACPAYGRSPLAAVQ